MADQGYQANFEPVCSFQGSQEACMRPHLLGSAIINQFQSAYKKVHSTKTDDFSGKVKKNHRSVILTARPVTAR